MQHSCQAVREESYYDEAVRKEDYYGKVVGKPASEAGLRGREPTHSPLMEGYEKRKLLW
ncbi:MAG: hypothetical protein GX795_00085 [Firmicutes bacterium]|jgi:hypothetical protein|nr:hypothetical protein [Bacillota bacterium]